MIAALTENASRVSTAASEAEQQLQAAQSELAATRDQLGQAQAELQSFEEELAASRQQLQEMSDQLQRSEKQVAAAAAGLPGGGASAAAGESASEAGAELAPEDVDRTLANHHADLSSPITLETVGQLTQVWSVASDSPISHAPLVDGDRVYFADRGGTVHAVEAASGEVLWRNTVEEPMTEWPWHGFAGTGAVDQGAAHEASAEGTAFALDAETGELLRGTRIAVDEQAGSIPRVTVWDGLVFVGLSSVEETLTEMREGFQPDFRGKALAFDAATGDPIREPRLVEAPHKGVAMWSSFALDPASGTLHLTTGNNSAGEATELSDSLVTLDARTGEIECR